MVDIRRFIGEGAHSGQQVDLYFIVPKVGAGVLTEVSMYRLAAKVKIFASGAEHSFSVAINPDSQGKDRGTCTVTFDGNEQKDASFAVDRYWINLHTNVLPASGRYSVWRNGRVTDVTTPPVRAKAWMVPANADAKELGYDPRLAGPTDEAP